MKVFILVGGLGQRLRPFTDVLPKPLLPLGERSILEVIMLKFKKQGFSDFILATNYKSDIFMNYLGDGSKLGVKITYSEEKKKLGTAGPIKLAENLIKNEDDFIVTNGDILTNLDFNEFIKFHKTSSADITVLTKMIELPLGYGVISSDEDNNIQKFQERPNIGATICAGVYALNKSILNIIPADAVFDMPQVINSALEKGMVVKEYSCKDYWLDLGRMEDYQKAKKDVSEGNIDG